MVFISKGGDKHNSNDLGRCKVDATPSFASTVVDKSKLYLDDASRLGGDGAGAKGSYIYHFCLLLIISDPGQCPDLGDG